jgi:hypothetical protein
MTLYPPRIHATDAVYSSGVAVGTPVKADPGAALTAQGIIPGVGFLTQHVNHQLNRMSAVDRVVFKRLALQLHEVRKEGATITDTAASMAAISIDPAQATLALKSDSGFWCTDWARAQFISQPLGIDGTVRDMATDGAGNIIAIGANSAGLGFGISKSNDNGGSWTAGADGTLDMRRVVYSENSSKFVISLAGTNSKFVLYTADGSIPLTSSDTGLAANGGGGGLAVLNAGVSDILVICGEATGAANRPFFRRSLDGGLTWTTGVQAAAGVFANFGSVVGNGGAMAYHVGTITGGGTLRVSTIGATGSALTMTTAATLALPAGATFATGSNPRILMCQNTGLLVVVAPLANGLTALYASQDGSDWVGPTLTDTDARTNGFALAGGKLFATVGAMLFASVGVL